MTRLDEARVDRPDGDLIHPVTGNLDERILAHVVGEDRRRIGIAQHREVARGPVSVPHDPVWQGVPDRLDAVEVTVDALETPCGIRDPGHRGHRGIVAGERHDELDRGLTWGEEDEDDPAAVLVLVGGDQGEPVCRVEEFAGRRTDALSRDLAADRLVHRRHDVGVSHRPAPTATTASRSTPTSGQARAPDTATTPSAAHNGTSGPVAEPWSSPSSWAPG